MYIQILCHFAVPVFFIVSGIVLARYKNFTLPALLDFYDKRVKSIVPQYLFFFFLYLYCYYRFDGWTPDMKYVFNNILKANIAYQFWFLIPLAQIYAIYPVLTLIYNWFDRYRKALILVLIIGIVQVCAIYYITTFAAIYQLFYFVFGMYIGRNYDILIPFLLNAIQFTWCYREDIKYGGYNNIPYHNMFIIIVYTLAFVSMIFPLYLAGVYLSKNRNVLSMALKEIAKYSFGIYLIHVLFVIYGERLLTNNGFTYGNWRFYIASYIITLAGSYIVIKAMSYLPYSKLLVGAHSNILKSLSAP